jgi:hypothetical protein
VERVVIPAAFWDVDQGPVVTDRNRTNLIPVSGLDLKPLSSVFSMARSRNEYSKEFSIVWGYNALLSAESLSKLRRNMSPPCSGLKNKLVTRFISGSCFVYS